MRMLMWASSGWQSMEGEAAVGWAGALISRRGQTRRRAAAAVCRWERWCAARDEAHDCHAEESGCRGAVTCFGCDLRPGR